MNQAERRIRLAEDLLGATIPAGPQMEPEVDFWRAAGEGARKRLGTLASLLDPMTWYRAIGSLPDPYSDEARDLFRGRGQGLFDTAMDWGVNPIASGLFGVIKNAGMDAVEELPDLIPGGRAANQVAREKAWQALERAAQQAGVKRNAKTGQYVGAAPGIASPQKKSAVAGAYAGRIDRTLKAGLPPDYFYGRGSEALAAATDNPVQHKLVADLYGPTSLSEGPFGNTNYTLRALDQYTMGAPIQTGMYPNKIRPTVEAVLAGDDPWKGYKMERYSNALGPEGLPRHYLADMPPNDQWENLAVGGKRGTVPSGPTQVAFTDHIRQTATDRLNLKRAEQGLPPLTLKQAQELHWAGIRAEDKGLVPQIDPKDTVQGALPSFEFQHSWEAKPGSMSGMTVNMPSREYFDELRKVVIDPQGKDNIVRATGGLMQAPAFEGGGVYQGVVSPGMQSRSYVGFTDSNGMEPASLARADLTEAFRQYFLGQDTRAGHLFRPATKSTPLSGIDTVEYATGSAVGVEQATQLQAKADTVFGAGRTVVVPSASGYRVLNIGQEAKDALPNKKFAELAKKAELPGDRTPGYRSGIYETRPEGAGGATKGLLATVDKYSNEFPNTDIIANGGTLRDIGGRFADVYRTLEQAGKLTGSQTLSLALKTYQSQGLEGLRELVRQGLAPAALLGLLFHYGDSSPPSDVESPRGLL